MEGRESKTQERQTRTASDGSPPGGTTAVTAVGLTIHSWLAAGADGAGTEGPERNGAAS